MKKCIFISICLLLSVLGYAQIVPDISARVDTTDTEVKQVYKLYSDYINSKPDSLYSNPYWNTKEAEKYKQKNLPPDRFHLFGNNSYDINSLSYFLPKILQIDKVEDDRYRIKTIFMSRCEDDEYKKFSPLAISKLYAVKDTYGYRLENVINYDTRNWPVYKYKYLTYIVHPYCRFNKKEAAEAIKFCDGIVKKFNLTPPQPITYYITPDSDELGKILNFDYWLSYSTGRAFPDFRELYVAFPKANYPHEFIHLLFPNASQGKRAFIINEGLATWLGGTSIDETFEDALQKLSLEIVNKNVTLDDIISNRYRNTLDNNPIYVSGAVLCKLVYEKTGITGIKTLLNIPQEQAAFEKGLEQLLQMKYSEIDKMIMNYIKRAALK